MNKIYKVIYSKVRQCYVVVSEIAKSHGRNTKSSVAKSSAVLTAAVLVALGAVSFADTSVVQAADGTESIRNNDYVGANGYYWYFDEKTNQWTKFPYKPSDINNNRSWKELPNYEGGGAKEPGSFAGGLYAQAGEQTITIGNRNAGQSKGSVFIGEQGTYNDGGKNNPSEKSMHNNYVTAVGFESDATGWGSIAIGSNAVAENTRETSQVVDYEGSAGTSGTVKDDNYGIKLKPEIKWSSVALGYNAHAKDGNIAIGADSEATDTSSATPYVSVGNSTLKRRITNVADGTGDNDVATVGQMNKAIARTGGSVKAGWGINKADDNTISVKHNLSTGSNAYADTDASGLILGGSVSERKDSKQYGAATETSVIVGAGNALASGAGSVVAGGLDNVASGANSAVVGGDNNNATASQSAVFGGRDNTASGITSTASGGIMNVANGQNSTAVGGTFNYALGTGSTSVGGHGKDYATGYNSSVNGSYSVGIAGGSTGDKADYSLAAGRQAVVTTENGTAIGYQATTDEANTIAFGHDKGDVSGYTVTWEHLPNGQTNADGTSNDYTKAPTVKKTTYDSAAYNRLVKVADGVEDHDVVVMEQLKNASDVGSNIKVYKTDENGNVQFDENNKPIEDRSDAAKTKQKDSKDAWGKALGAGTFTTGTPDKATDASTSDQLVTGKTLFNYDKPTGTQNYVKDTNTTGQNLSALDAQVKANADALTKPNHNIKYYSVTAGPSLGYDQYTNENNDGAKGTASLAAGNVTHTDGVASTVVGSYSAVFGTGLQGAAALSYGTVNVNNNTDTTKKFSGVANSIVGQANMTTNSNAAIIYGAGNTVTDSYRDIDKDKAEAILNSTGNAEQLKNALQDAVPTSGAQVMVMGGGNTVDKAYMTQVTGVGNKVTGADSTYTEGTSTQYNFVDGFQNELTNGKHDYIIGSKNKVSGDSVDTNQSNIIFGDNHKLTNQQNNVIIGSSDTADDETTASNIVAIGHNAKVSAEGGVAIGSGSEATVEGNKVAGYDPATGKASTNTTSATWQATNGAVSIGKADGTVTRQINGVAAGTNETDAVNVAQLKTAQTGLTNKGLTFAGDDGSHTAKLGDTVKIYGSTQNKDHEYTSDNLTTKVDKDGNIQILMDKNMSADKIVVGQEGKEGKQGHIGLAGADGTNGKDGTNAVDITVKNGYDDTAKGINGTNGVDGKDGITRIVYTDKTGEHQVATLEDGMKYAGDDGQTDTTKAIAKKLNNTVDIIGGAKGALTEENIGVNNVNGKLKVQLAKDLKDLNSTSYTTTTGEGDQATTSTTVVVNGNGLTVTGGPSITKDGINGGGKAVTNVGSGADADGKYTNTTNAANIGDVQAIAGDATTKLTNKGLTFAGDDGSHTAKLGDTVKIYGSTQNKDHEYTSDNLTTKVDKDGNIQILMDKNMSADQIVVGKDGKQGHIGLTGADGTNGKDGKTVDITVKKGYDDTAKGINGTNGVDGKNGISRIVYEDGTGEHQVATLEDGMKYAGDDGQTDATKAIAKKLNNTVDIIGGAKGALTEENIGVNNVNGKLKVQLAKDLKDLNSTSYTTTTGEGDQATTSTTVVDGNGLRITGGPSITNNGVDAGNKAITNVGSGADASGKYTEATKSNAANIGDVQNIVNDAKQELTNGENGLNSKANVDASNIGTNLAADKQQDNLNKWGNAIGTGKVEANNRQLVTGKTVYDEVRPKKDGSYVKKNQTTGENLSALDSKIGKLDETKTYNYIDSDKDVSISDNLTKLDTQVKTNADNIANNTKSIQDITNNMQNLNENAVKYDNSSKSTVTLGGGNGGTTITNVKDGTLSDSSTEAVNGRQLYKEQQDREKADKEITQKVTNNTTEINKIKDGEGFTDKGKTVIKKLSQDAVQVKAGDRIKVDKATDEATGNKTYTISANNNGTVTKGDGNLISGDTLYKEVHVDKDGSYIKSGSTVGQNLSSLDAGLKTTSDLIHTNAKGDTIQIGGNSTATKIDVSGKDKDGKSTGRVITGIVSDASDPNSAANVGYVNGITEANNEQIYHDMNMQYNHVENDISRAAAGSNALAALHPMQEFDPDDKAQFALGYGHYRNSNAGAVGAFYQPDENSMVNFGVSFGNGDAGINAGVTFKFGPGGSGHHALTKTQMAKVIDAQSKEIDELKKDNADKDKRIDALEQKMTEILAKLDKSKD